MNVPFTAIHFATYESAKKLLKGHEEESLAVQLLAGGTAGAAAAAATNPLDVVKTRLQLEGVNSATRYGTTAVVTLSSRLFYLLVLTLLFPRPHCFWGLDRICGSWVVNDHRAVERWLPLKYASCNCPERPGMLRVNGPTQPVLRAFHWSGRKVLIEYTIIL